MLKAHNHLLLQLQRIQHPIVSTSTCINVCRHIQIKIKSSLKKENHSDNGGPELVTSSEVSLPGVNHHVSHISSYVTIKRDVEQDLCLHYRIVLLLTLAGEASLQWAEAHRDS